MAEFDGRRADPLEWARAAVGVGAAVVVLLIGGSTGVFWNLVLNNVRLIERVENVVRANTELASRVSKLEHWRIDHTQWGYQTSGRFTAKWDESDRRIDQLEKDAKVQINHTHNDDKGFFELMKGMQGTK